MVVVSSIDHTAITNVYNDGANTLRSFLHYADAVSNGDEAAAPGVLAGCGTRPARGGAERRRADRASRSPTPSAPRASRWSRRRRTVRVPLRPGAAPVGAPEHTVAVLVDHSARLAGTPSTSVG